MNDKETVSGEVFDGERMWSGINVCTDKHDLEEKYATLSSPSSSGALKSPLHRFLQASQPPGVRMTYSASSPPSFRQEALMQGDRQKEQRRAFVAVHSCGERDLPRLDSTKHQHTPAQITHVNKRRRRTPFSHGHVPHPVLLPPVCWPKWDFCTDNNKGFIICHSAQEEKKTSGLWRWLGEPLQHLILCLISRDISVPESEIQLITLESTKGESSSWQHNPSDYLPS